MNRPLLAVPPSVAVEADRLLAAGLPLRQVALTLGFPPRQLGIAVRRLRAEADRAAIASEEEGGPAR